MREDEGGQEQKKPEGCFSPLGVVLVDGFSYNIHEAALPGFNSSWGDSRGCNNPSSLLDPVDGGDGELNESVDRVFNLVMSDSKGGGDCSGPPRGGSNPLNSPCRVRGAGG